MSESSASATQLLQRVSKGESEALEELMPLVYSELKKIASGYFRDEPSSHTLQPTALVHEAWVRLIGQDQPEYESRTHFFAIAAITMRRILVEHARRRLANKRGGDWARVTLEDSESGGELDVIEILDVHRALEELEQLSPRQAKIVELRWFGGMSVPEVARHLDVVTRTVERDWTMAKAWLRVRLTEASGST